MIDNMDDIGIPVDEILKTYGGVQNFRMENVLDPDDNDDVMNCIQPSLCYETENLPSYLKS